MRFPQVLIPVLFFVEGWLIAAIFLTFVPLPHFPTWWVTVGAGILVAIGLSAGLKRRLVSLHQRTEKMVPTTVEQHVGLEVAALDSLTTAYGAIGFETQIDYTVTWTPPSPLDGFARLLYNPATHVLVELNQVMVRGVPATTMAATLFSIFEDDWSFTTTTRRPTRNTAIVYALRRPNRL